MSALPALAPFYTFDIHVLTVTPQKYVNIEGIISRSAAKETYLMVLTSDHIQPSTPRHDTVTRTDKGENQILSINESEKA